MLPCLEYIEDLLERFSYQAGSSPAPVLNFYA